MSCRYVHCKLCTIKLKNSDILHSTITVNNLSNIKADNFSTLYIFRLVDVHHPVEEGPEEHVGEHLGRKRLSCSHSQDLGQ